jgi:hypothetical protein
MGRRPNPALQALWRDRISRQATSGLSIEQFCAQGCFSRSAFYRWKHLLRLMNPADRGQRSTPPAPSTFLPVAVRLVESNVSHPALIEADLPNGIRLRIPDANAHLACRLVGVLARAKTDSGGSQ